MPEKVNLFYGLTLMQDERFHKLGLDSILLSQFITLRPHARILDIGAGVGVLSLLLAGRSSTVAVDGIEILPEACALARTNAQQNGLSHRVHFFPGDIRTPPDALSQTPYDAVISNPPYFPEAAGKPAAKSSLKTTRCDHLCPLDTLIRFAAGHLKFGGYFALVHRPERLSEIFYQMTCCHITPKRLRLVQKTAASAPSLVLIEGKHSAAPGLRILPPLILQDSGGQPSAEICQIYKQGGIDC